MQFKLQYWEKSELVDMPVSEAIFTNMSELKDYLKIKLKGDNFKNKQWTVLLDKSDIGQGHYTIFHSETSANKLESNFQRIPKYKNWVADFKKDIEDMLKKEKIKYK